VLSRPIKLAPNPLFMRIKQSNFQVPTKNPKKGNRKSLGILSLYSLDYLSMKEGSLFCFVLFCFSVMRSTEPGCFRSRSWCLWCSWSCTLKTFWGVGVIEFLWSRIRYNILVLKFIHFRKSTLLYVLNGT
jgi:hypothetical protein